MQLRTVGDHSFHATAAQAWNTLPASVTTASALMTMFKRQLKTFLFYKSVS